MSFPHRLFVLTDISSLESGLREPDDGQSLIRLLFYSGEIQIEGLCATSNLGHGQVCRPELIRRVIDAYEHDWPLLSRHDAHFPHATHLREKVGAGQPTAGPQVPVADSIGPQKNTSASELLIQAVDRADERPLWVAVWGGTADLAQALFQVRESRKAPEVEKFVRKLRIHASYDQDSTASWIKSEFPNLFYITREHGIRGMYRGGDTSLVSAQWVEENVMPNGALRALYPNYRGGDPWGAVRGVKEGDTPCYLNLIAGSNPLNGWGGAFVETEPQRWTDAPQDNSITSDLDPRIGAIYQHRPAYQADFARRLRWCHA